VKPRVLFVDDEDNVLSGLKRMLRGQRAVWEMDFANSGSVALAKFAENPFDVVVSDMRMPGMDGAELLNRIAEDYPQAVRLVLSGQSEHERIFRANGHGISAEHLDHVFEPFFTTRPEGVGTGLGLSIAYGIVRRHQGSISISSQVGSGTKVSIRLPLSLESAAV
jgi:CheY-like chemotaxis protein